MTPRYRSVAVVVVGVLALASCGSGSDSTDSDPPDSDPPTSQVAPSTVETATTVTTAATATTVTTTTDAPAVTEAPEPPAQDIEADTAAAQAALLTLSDFPSGWTEKPAEENLDNDETNRRLAECVGLDRDNIRDSPARTETGDFTSPEEDTEISQYIGVEPTEQDAIDVIAGMADPDTPACFAEVYNDTFVDSADLPDGTEVGVITVDRLSPAPAGDDVQAVRVYVPLAVDGFEIDVFADIVLVRVGRTLSGLYFATQFSPVSDETIDEYTALAASRLPTGAPVSAD